MYKSSYEHRGLEIDFRNYRVSKITESEKFFSNEKYKLILKDFDKNLILKVNRKKGKLEGILKQGNKNLEFEISEKKKDEKIKQTYNSGKIKITSEIYKKVNFNGYEVFNLQINSYLLNKKTKEKIYSFKEEHKLIPIDGIMSKLYISQEESFKDSNYNTHLYIIKTLNTSKLEPGQYTLISITEPKIINGIAKHFGFEDNFNKLIIHLKENKEKIYLAFFSIYEDKIKNKGLELERLPNINFNTKIYN